MKIERGGGAGGSSASAGARGAASGTASSANVSAASGVSSAAFAEALDGAQAVQVSAELDELIRRIDEQAVALVQKRTVTELEKYREMVTSFLSLVVKRGWKVEEIPSAHFLDNNKVFVRARKVEEALLELAERIREGNAEALKVTAATSEIRGLLLDLRW